MEPRAKEWMLATARGDYHAIARLLREEPRLARRRVRQLINFSFFFFDCFSFCCPDVIFCFHLFWGQRENRSAVFPSRLFVVTCLVSSPSISVHLMRRRRPCPIFLDDEAGPSRVFVLTRASPAFSDDE